MHLQSLLSISCTLAFASVSPFVHCSIAARQDAATTPSVKVTDIWDFPLGTWVENLAIRSNGQILATLFNAPEVYQVDPTKKTPATLVHKFPNYLGCRGINELKPDIFYISVGNLSATVRTGGVGSYSVWRLDMNGYRPGGATPTAHKVADFPTSQYLNGMVPHSPSSTLLLIADSRVGVLFTLDVASGAVKEAIMDPLMAPTATGIDVGINGVKVRHGHLYFTNTDQALLAKEALNAQGGPAAKAKAIASNLTALDDFQFDCLGNQFIAGNNELRYRPAAGGAVTVLSTSGLLNGSTAVQFGRLESDRKSAYVSTSGGKPQYVTKVYTTPGRIVRVDVAGVEC